MAQASSVIPGFSVQYSEILLQNFFQCKDYDSLPEIVHLSSRAMPEKYRELSQRLPFPRDMVDSQGVCHSVMRWKSPDHGDTLVVGWNRETTAGREHQCTIFLKDSTDAPFRTWETLERSPKDGSRLDFAWSRFSYGKQESLINDKVFAAVKTVVAPTAQIPLGEVLATDGYVILRN